MDMRGYKRISLQSIFSVRSRGHPWREGWPIVGSNPSQGSLERRECVWLSIERKYSDSISLFRCLVSNKIRVSDS